MSFWLYVLSVVWVIPLSTFLSGLSQQLRRRSKIAAHLTSPKVLSKQATAYAEHAGECGLPLAPWYELAAFWERLEDYEPEIVRPAVYVVGPGMPKPPVEPTEQHVWTLSGTDEDNYVIEALRNHDVSVRTDLATDGTRAACLVGTHANIEAAEREYRHGLLARHGAVLRLRLPDA